MFLPAAIERLYDLKVGTTSVQEGWGDECPHKLLFLRCSSVQSGTDKIIIRSGFCQFLKISNAIEAYSRDIQVPQGFYLLPEMQSIFQ